MLLLSLALRLTAQEHDHGHDHAEVTPPARPFLWRIQGARPSYLFGTIHLPDPRVTTLHPDVERAVAECDALYTEIELNLKATSAALRATALPRGQELGDLIGPELTARLESFFEARNLSFAAFRRMRPWAVATQVPLIASLRKQASMKALDVVLYETARGEDKIVGGVETVEEQLGALAGLTDAEQVIMLRESLDTAEYFAARNIDYLDHIVEAYRTGSGKVLLTTLEPPIAHDQALHDRIERLLLFERNVRMADRMAKLLREHPDRSHFFAIGTAHYFGEQNLVDLLTERGFEVVRVHVDSTEEIESLKEQIEAAKRQIESLERRLRQWEETPRKKAG